jgi:hypothetical protein
LRSLAVSLEQVPKEMPLGGTIRYIVVLTNRSSSPVPLRPCPAYAASYGESATIIAQISYLNCGAAPSVVDPGASVPFEMKMRVEGRGISEGFSGTLTWGLLPKNESQEDSTVTIPVRSGPSSTPTSRPAERPFADSLSSKGKTLGQGVFTWGSQGGRWAVFLEGPPRLPTLRFAAVLESGDVVCHSAGSADGFDTGTIRASICLSRDRSYSLLLGLVPSDALHVEGTLGGSPAGRRTLSAVLSSPVEDSGVRPMALVYPGDESLVTLRAYRSNGSVLEQRV